MTWMCSNLRWSKKTSSNEADLVLNIWKMGRRSEQQLTVVTNTPSWPGIYFRDISDCFSWTCCAVLLDSNSTGWKQFPLTPFLGLRQIFPINASRELLPGSQSSGCVGIPVDESFPVSTSHPLSLAFPRKHTAVSSLLWSCMSKSALPGELDCLMEWALL